MKYWYVLKYPLGWAVLFGTNGYLTQLRFFRFKPKFDPKVNSLVLNCATQLKQYFEQKRKYFDCPLKPGGTNFQQLVWDRLLTVPYGHVITYAQLANLIGKPKAYRAVANALGANPLPVFIPCHRVIRSDGSLGGFSQGLDIKKFLLSLEGVTF